MKVHFQNFASLPDPSAKTTCGFGRVTSKSPSRKSRGLAAVVLSFASRYFLVAGAERKSGEWLWISFVSSSNSWSHVCARLHELCIRIWVLVCRLSLVNTSTITALSLATWALCFVQYIYMHMCVYIYIHCCRWKHLLISNNINYRRSMPSLRLIKIGYARKHCSPVLQGNAASISCLISLLLPISLFCSSGKLHGEQWYILWKFNVIYIQMI